MESRRQSQHEDDTDQSAHQIPSHHSKRRREEDASVVCIMGKWRRPVLNIKTDIVPYMEKFLPKIIRDEVESKLLPRASINYTGTSGTKFLKLVFKSDLPGTIFTLSKIKAEVALYDIRSQKIVSDGTLSSSKVVIWALDSELGFNCTEEDWSTDKFKEKILCPRANKGLLLKGDHIVISLVNGVGKITDLMFTDNSRWIRSRHFRLGAIMQSTPNQAIIKEAISNRFIVKDSRGEANQKHYPPSLSDPIWRLVKIQKDGKVHEWLSGLKINTVEDLLHINQTDPSLQQNKYGKNIQEAIKHAKTCPEVASNGQNYLYQKTTLYSDENAAPSLDSFIYRGETGKQQEDVIIVTSASGHTFPSPLPTPLQLPSHCCAPQVSHDQLEKGQDFSQPSTSTVHIIGEAYAAYNNQIECAELLHGMYMEENDAFLLGPHVPTDVADDVFKLFN